MAGDGGLLQQLTKRILESALEGEITDHPGHDKGDPAGKKSGNSRNDVRAKTTLTDAGPVEIAVPTRPPAGISDSSGRCAGTAFTKPKPPPHERTSEARPSTPARSRPRPEDGGLPAPLA
nr:transposase [Micromonospora kangleipakensis]